MAFSVKRFYQHADAEALRPILEATAALVSRVTGEDFAWEAGVGAVSAARRFAIVPACAGLNFAVILLASLALGPARTAACPLRVVVLAAALVPTSTILVNSARVTLALWLAPHGPLHGLIATVGSPEDRHRALGVVVYVVALIGAQALASRWTLSPRPSGEPR